MKALVQDRDVSVEGGVHIEDVEMPRVGDNEVLVRVRAASAKTWGWDLPAVVQAIGRVAARFRKPKAHVPGLDFAGEVEQVGKGVTRFRPGDAVFGWSSGALAEYVSVAENALASKPSNLSFAEAATIAVSASTALRALRKGQVGSGDVVAVVGASGGVGLCAVQLAKMLGAGVAGVCSTQNLDLVRSVGADHVIDYTAEDFTRTGRRYDVILDMAGTHSLSELRRALQPHGTLVMVGQSGIPTSEQNWFKALGRWLSAAVWSRFIGQRLVALIQTKGEADLLMELGEFIEAGTLKPVVAATYPLSDAPEVIERLGEGHGQARVVIEFSGAAEA